MNIAFFILGLLFLIKGAGYLVDGASSIARRFHVSDLAIGLTVVAFGTSLPELSVNILSSIRGNADIAIGNVVGSNIANILLILGLSALVRPLSVSRGTVFKEIPLSLLAALLLGILASDHLIDNAPDSILSRSDGLTLLCFFLVFLSYSFSISKRVDNGKDLAPARVHGTRASILRIVGGLCAMILGGSWIVKGAVGIALAAGVSQSLVGLTIVAVGTSLPELATSVTAARMNKPEIAVGNVVGSNIFNIFFILGVTSLVSPLPFQTQNLEDVGVVILASFLLFLSLFVGKSHSLGRIKGALFLLLYAAYCARLAFRG
ncbi:MAG: calcium/sodium antiporter [Proteobacteria bacterium]|nr:calcium/sodium antiporter [Pseudomonadota bacterium]